jgi:hypothetical protein
MDQFEGASGIEDMVALGGLDVLALSGSSVPKMISQYALPPNGVCLDMGNES